MGSHVLEHGWSRGLQGPAHHEVWIVIEKPQNCAIVSA